MLDTLAAAAGSVCAGLVLLLVLLVLGGYLWRITAGRPLTALRAWSGSGLGVKELARRLDVPLDELRTFEPRYRSVAVPKKGGDYRRLLVPDRDTKYLQRRILWRLLARLRAHPAACGFEKGKSIVHNALPHVGQGIVIKIDVEDFFDTTSADRVERYFRRIGWNAKAAALLVKLTCYDGALPQGAPTSPRISNVVNFHLDLVLGRFAERSGGAYTRYADDITFSFPDANRGNLARSAVRTARTVLSKKGYRMHERKKLSIRRPHQQQLVTGLVVNEKLQLPRRVRRWLRAVKHHQSTRGYSSLKAEQLEGWLALERMIERQRDSA